MTREIADTLSPSEIAIILRHDPGFALPRFSPDGVNRMAFGRGIVEYQQMRTHDPRPRRKQPGGCLSETSHAGLPVGVKAERDARPVTPPNRKANKILEGVLAEYGGYASELLGPSRRRILIEPRNVLAWLLRTRLKWPLPEIGRLIGGRNHSTIMHAISSLDPMPAEVGARIARIAAALEAA